MKRQWRIRREFLATSDGQRCWDQAYQQLLGWTTPTAEPSAPVASGRAAEEQHASSDVRAGLDTAPGAGADDRAATRAAAGPRRGAGLGGGGQARLPRRRLQ